jgi:hypothetical protein
MWHCVPAQKENYSELASHLEFIVPIYQKDKLQTSLSSLNSDEGPKRGNREKKSVQSKRKVQCYKIEQIKGEKSFLG